MTATPSIAARPPAADLSARVQALAGRPSTWIAATTLVLGLSMAAVVASFALHHVPMPPEDDAEYYRVIARNLAASGVSTFDGQTLTNGYHPLWEWILAVQMRLFGDSFTLTQALEIALVTAAFPLFLIRSGLRTPLAIVVMLGVYGRFVAGLSLQGMEVSLLAGCAGWLVWTLGPEADRSPLTGGAWIGLALAAAVLARIDAAVFVLPLVAFAPVRRRTRLIAFATAGAIGAGYAAYNLTVFGTALPISSAVKSLGGLQVNHRLLQQLADGWRQDHFGARHLHTFAILALSPLFLLLSRPNSLGRALAGAALVGGVLFIGKLLFDSSWRIWPWYDFPVTFGLWAGAFTLGPRIEALAGRGALRLGPIAKTAAAVLAGVFLAVLVFKAANVLAKSPPTSATRFDIVNAEAARRFAPIMRGERVAMGDRAGAFAAIYPGGVTQMEGLVNDRTWYEALKAKADLKPILCDRGVRFVAAYQKELGAYREAIVPAMRPTLTQFPGPALRLPATAEVGHFSDRAAFDMSGFEDEDDVFYLWRLDCEPSRSP